MMFAVLALTAALVGVPSNVEVRDVLASKFRSGTLLELIALHIDPTSSTSVCGRVTVDRGYQPIRFIVDTRSKVAWLEQAPREMLSQTVLIDPKATGLSVGSSEPLYRAWLACRDHGAPISSI